MSLTSIAAIIISISGVIVAVRNIYAFLKDSGNLVNEKTKQHYLKEIEEQSDAIYEKFEEKIKETITSTTMEQLDKILEYQELQHQGFKQIEEVIDLFTKIQTDSIRCKITEIYYRSLDEKKILDYDKKSLCELYEDYIALGGNSYIHQIFEEMMEFEVIHAE